MEGLGRLAGLQHFHGDAMMLVFHHQLQQESAHLTFLAVGGGAVVEYLNVGGPL